MHLYTKAAILFFPRVIKLENSIAKFKYNFTIQFICSKTPLIKATSIVPIPSSSFTMCYLIYKSKFPFIIFIKSVLFTFVSCKLSWNKFAYKRWTGWNKLIVNFWRNFLHRVHWNCSKFTFNYCLRNLTTTQSASALKLALSVTDSVRTLLLLLIYKWNSYRKKKRIASTEELWKIVLQEKCIFTSYLHIINGIIIN